MRAVDIIEKKRDGNILSGEEIEFFVQGYAHGEIPDYQASAWAMAVYLRGMNADETTQLTLAMAHSGEILDLSSIAPQVLDKHSSGGVGDKTTLVVGPIIAALGLPFGKMSGHGLGFSGGTLDKLEAIPGMRVDLNTQEFLAQLRKYGIVVNGQTHDLAPADGKLYALRDVTATVSCIPLIASSIMSKKIAAGAQVIGLDVKVGRGAFMKTESEATALAELMVQIGHGAGRKVCAVISDMNQPLGLAVGNTLEVEEAIETLKGRGPKDFTAHCFEMATQLLLLAGVTTQESAARAKAIASLADGSALKKFVDMVHGQGGNRHVIDDYSMMPHAKIVEDVLATRDGFISQIDAGNFGITSVLLGGGREKKGDGIDYGVGIVLKHKVGERVKSGDTLFTLHANDRARFDMAKTRLLAAYLFSDTEPVPLQLTHRVIK